MDEFLTNLYHEEQEKVAAADLGNFMESVPASELEDFLGLSKTAVAGPAEPPLPTKGGNPEKDQKKVEKEVDSEEAKKEAQVRRITKIARIDWGQAGRTTLSNTALGAGLGAGIGALRADEGKRGMGALRGAAIGGAAGLGASAGSFLGGQAVRRFGNKNALDRADNIRAGLAAGFAPGAIAGGVIARHATASPEENAELARLAQKGEYPVFSGVKSKKKQGSVAAEKAKIAMRVMSTTRDAPPHIKQAAAHFAGQEMAKVAKLPSGLRGDLRPDGWVIGNSWQGDYPKSVQKRLRNKFYGRDTAREIAKARAQGGIKGKLMERAARTRGGLSVKVGPGGLVGRVKDLAKKIAKR